MRCIVAAGFVVALAIGCATPHESTTRLDREMVTCRKVFDNCHVERDTDGSFSVYGSKVGPASSIVL